MPDGRQHPDFRDLPQRPDLRDTVSAVESLGLSCELGLVQRHCHAELDRYAEVTFAADASYHAWLRIVQAAIALKAQSVDGTRGAVTAGDREGFSRL